MKKIKECILLILLLPLFIQAQQSIGRKNIQGKEVFFNKFPQTLSFRNDKLGLRDDYSYWDKAHYPFNSITKKYLQEEVDMDPVIAKWANRYALKHPEKLMLIHLNGEGRSVNDKGIHKIYFPGHWIYEEGTFPVDDIDNKQKEIEIELAKPFSERAYVVHGRDVEIDRLPHDVIIVETDDNGNRLWDKYEFATIETVDYENNKIVVSRGQYSSKPRAFKKDRTYIAPLAGASWGGNLMWYYNLSSCCPLDSEGNSCSDVFVKEMKKWFSPDGVLANIDGIGFDVNYFESDHETWDCNNDGIADRGFIDGKNLWRIGDLDFLSRIRTTFGDEFIITADGWRDEMQRAVGLFNGMETEGLCRWNDGYRQISRTINQHTYWNMHNSAKYQFSYITSKLSHPDDQKLSTQLHRMGMALSCCLGVAYAYSAPLYIPEASGGTLNKPNWLGEPVSELKYTAKETPDLLKGAGVEMNKELVNKFDLSDVDYKLVDNTLYISGKGSDVYEEIIVPGPEITIPSGDLIVFFEAKAIKGFADLPEDGQIPRKINIRLEGLPEYPTEPLNTHELHNDLSGFMGTKGFTPQMFYFRNVGNIENAIKMIFEAEEQGEFAIRNLRVHNAPATMVREFENGIVMVNPSLQAYYFNLKSLYPRLDKYRRIKIDPSKTENLDGDFIEVSSYNNGEKIKNTSKITVPALNALFLIKSD